MVMVVNIPLQHHCALALGKCSMNVSFDFHLHEPTMSQAWVLRNKSTRNGPGPNNSSSGRGGRDNS